MVTVKALFDGERVILPDDFHARGRGEVTVSFPDELITPVIEARRSIWDLLNDGYQPKRTFDEAMRELREDRDSWDDDPRDRLERPK